MKMTPMKIALFSTVSFSFFSTLANATVIDSRAYANNAYETPNSTYAYTETSCNPQCSTGFPLTNFSSESDVVSVAVGESRSYRRQYDNQLLASSSASASASARASTGELKVGLSAYGVRFDGGDPGNLLRLHPDSHGQSAYASITEENIIFEVDPEFYGQEIMGSAYMFIDGTATNLSSIFAQIDSRGRRRVFREDGLGIQSIRDDYSARFEAVGSGSWDTHIKFDFIIQGAGETLDYLLWDRFRSSLSIGSSNYIAEGDFMNTANVFFDIPDIVSTNLNQTNFLSSQYSRFNNSTSVNSPTTLTLLILGFATIRLLKKRSLPENPQRQIYSTLK